MPTSAAPAGPQPAGAPGSAAGRGGADARGGGGAIATAGMASVAGSAAISGISAAISGSGGASGTGAAMSGETGRIVGMTAAHNAVRARIMKPAPNPPLPPLTWSNELAMIAQAYAEKLAMSGDCLDLVHSMDICARSTQNE